MEQKKFKTEVSELLHLIIHSLYSHKEIFLRELISNASDALDKLKYLTLVEDKYKDLKFDPRIELTFTEDEKKKVLVISDNGIGMSYDDLGSDLGTTISSISSTIKRTSKPFFLYPSNKGERLIASSLPPAR
jgi:molecular chaperone HtpG